MQKIQNIKIIVAVVVLIIASVPSVFGISNNPITQKNIDKQQAGFKAVNIDENTIKIAVNPMGFNFDTITTEKGMFTTITLQNSVYSQTKGEAKLPVIRKMIEIPQESNLEITIKSMTWEYTSLSDLGLPDRIVPAQQSVEKIPEPIIDFAINEEYYSSNTYSPETIAKIADIGEMRSRRFALVEISPIQYKPATGELKILNSCEIILKLSNSDLAKTYGKIKRYSSPSFERIFETAFENYGFYENGILNRNQEGYLIIVYNDFFDEIQPLVDMKTSKGFDTTVKKTSEIPGGPTRDNIKTFIQDAYENWNVPPTYILLVGDTPQIPTYPGTTGPTAVDLYYVTVDGTDFIPDIFIGRFPGSQESHIEAMVDKTIYYEVGSFPSTEWIKKAAFLASTDNWQISEGTHNYVIDKFLAPNEYTCDKLYTHSYGATTQQVTDAINDGRSLVIYSGHGGPTGWGDGPPFYQPNVENLMNENMYPFVCSHACSTNTFDDPECFGETWLREADKAALAFWGASASTYWNEDDILERGMFQAWWEDGLESIGGMTDMGLLYLYENYSGGGSTKYYFEAYNVNGDPSVKIWNKNPSLPPETPTVPNGPVEWVQFTETMFTSTTSDPEGDSIYYLFDWGDGNNSGWVGPYASGQTGEASHVWTEIGNYEVKVMAKDIYNSQSDWSEPATITIIVNSPPDNPIIKGLTKIKIQKEYTYTISAEDPNNHNIYYSIWWGDGDYLEWIGPYASGEEVSVKNAWPEVGTYTIQVRAKDSIGYESGTTTLQIKVTKDKVINNPILSQFLKKTIENFPLLIQLLKLC